MTQHEIHDIFIIGAGVNGSGIAMDAAGRGLSVTLCEMDDLASATSSRSSKLIHGGLRYLEFYEFRLVREALAEREALLKNAPHIMWPMRFRLPHRPHLRPAWMIRIGLFLYDNLAKRERLAASKVIRFDPQGPMAKHINRGFEYSDGWVDDARLVVLAARAAADRSARILTRSRCVSAVRQQDLWQITVADQASGEQQQYYARALVNAAGPWVSRVLGEALGQTKPKPIRMVKGSHIVVPRLHTEEQAYILQNEDGRIVFVIPYEDQFSLIGTTDVDYQGDPAQVAISAEESEYLIQVVNAHFKQPVSSSDVVWRFSGVRPLMDDERTSAQKASRDYAFELDAKQGAPLLSIYGGKITTYRKLAEAALDKLCQYFPNAKPAWTRDARLPGGDFKDHSELGARYSQRYPWLPEAQLKRYIRTYGTLTEQILDGCPDMTGLGQCFGASLYAREVDYLVRYEWAQTAEDVLWRRTKLGLLITAEKYAELQCHIDSLKG